jgi:hypothetical protein
VRKPHPSSCFILINISVIGWLQLSPRCNYSRVREALDRSNSFRAFVATEGPKKHVPAGAITGFRAFNLVNTHGDASRRDEEATAPIYNYARVLPWVESVETVAAAFEAAARQAERNREKSGLAICIPLPSLHVDPHMVAPERRRRGSKEFIRVDEYACVDESLAQLRRRFNPAFASRCLIASVLALSLQWGTIGGAIAVAVCVLRWPCDLANIRQQWFTPTVGLGCRSGSYLLYAAAGTLVWAMMVASSFLTHYAACAPRGPSGNPRSARVARTAATALRRMGKAAAALNAVWGLLACIFEFSSFFSRCWCNSDVLSLGANAFNVIALSDQDMHKIKTAWILGAWRTHWQAFCT